MNVLLNCPVCQEQVRAELGPVPEPLQCAHCHWTRPVAPADVAEGRPHQCVVCGCEDLWRQKDFPVALGLACVTLGAALFLVAMAYYLPWYGIGILMVFAAADLLLYVFLKDILVCYRCHARYRQVALPDSAGRFQLETFERYRQETVRLKEAGLKGDGS